MIDLIEAPVAFDRGAEAKWRGLQFIEEEANPILPAATLNARDLTQVLVHYRVPSLGRSIIELAMTVGPLVLLWALMWATLHISYWLCLLLAVPTAGFLVRLFMIQHDCGHGAFFRRRGTNDWAGRVIGVLTFTPYDFWRPLDVRQS